jgi:hypothetical protein
MAKGSPMNAAPLVTGLGTIAGIGAAQVAWVV